MTDIETEVDEALAIVKGARKCSAAEANQIVETAKELFVEGNPRVWWLSLRGKTTTFHYPKSDGYRHVTDHLPNPKERFWFIPETEEDALPVYEVSIDELERIVSDCSGFEYYLVGKNYEWLMIETDHNELVVAKRPELH